MGGIVGYYAFNIDVSIEEFRQAIRSIKHRGSNIEKYYVDKNVCLGYVESVRKVELISRSQPVTSADGRYLIVLDGSIYNFEELAKKLNLTMPLSNVLKFFVESFAQYGQDVVAEFNGMFATAIWDKTSGIITLFRDRLGKKPLFYFYDRHLFAFASEIKALLHFSHIRNKISLNLKALNYYLHLGFIPEPLTIYEGIYKFPAATVGIFTGKSFSMYSYWAAENQLSDKYLSNEIEAKEQLKNLLYNAMKYRLITDKPFGVLLSGGTDSSLVTALTLDLGGDIRTFSINFRENRYNEAPYARAIATFLGTKHTEFIMTFDDAEPMIDEMIDHYDEPFADASAIPMMMVAKLAKNEVDVVFTGDGGDEFFWGYGAYRWAKRLSNPILNVFRSPMKLAFLYGPSRYKRVAHMLNYTKYDFLPAHILSQELYFFTTKEIKELYTYASNLTFSTIFSLNRDLHVEELQSLFDLKYYLKDDLLVKTDRATMKYALEVRSPLLDYRLIEFAYNLHPTLKHHNRVDKYLLKQVLYDYVPSSLFDRPKQGFAIPLDIWFQQKLHSNIKTYFSSLAHRLSRLFDMNRVNRLLMKYDSGHKYLCFRIWNLYVLFRWLERKNMI